MKYKLICVDMDGTLLNNNKEISSRNKKAIEKASELDVKFAISTGRIFTSANYYADLVGLKAPIIASNGAYIREKDINKIIYKSLLGVDRCNLILKMFKAFDIVPHFYTSNSIYAGEIVHSSAYYSAINKKMPKERRIHIEKIENWDDLFYSQGEELLKAVAIDDDINKIRQAKNAFLNLEGFEVVSSLENNFEIMVKGTSKGQGVKILCDYYGFTRDEVICIGDNENDLSMIEFAGLGVAMGNGEDFVKLKADYVTASNEDDGVAKVIEKFILCE